MSLNTCYNLFIIRSFRLLCTVVSLFYVCVEYRHVRIVRTCDKGLGRAGRGAPEFASVLGSGCQAGG